MLGAPTDRLPLSACGSLLMKGLGVALLAVCPGTRSAGSESRAVRRTLRLRTTLEAASSIGLASSCGFAMRTITERRSPLFSSTIFRICRLILSFIIFLLLGFPTWVPYHLVLEGSSVYQAICYLIVVAPPFLLQWVGDS